MTETQRNIAETTFTTDYQEEMLQPSLLFSILSKGWGAGLNREGGGGGGGGA